MNPSFQKILRRSDGLALLMVIFVMAFFLVFVTGSLFFAQLNLKTTSNLRLSNQAINVADAGLQHALASSPWVWDFDFALACGQPPPCTVISQAPFPSLPDFSYTVTVKNDPQDPDFQANPQNLVNDTNNIIVVTSEALGPGNTRRTVEAYVRRSTAPFTPPAPFYVNAVSASPQADSSNSSASGFFDLDNSNRIIGHDINPNDLTSGTDDTLGPQPSLRGISTTSDIVQTVLQANYAAVGGEAIHDVVGVGGEPSIGQTADKIDVDKIAENFFQQAGATLILDGLQANSTACPSSIPSSPPAPVSCTVQNGTSYITLGTSSSPQIVYIRDTNSTSIVLRGNVTGYGVLVLEGKAVVGANFKYSGLVVSKRSDPSRYVSFEDNAWVYGGVLVGSFDEGDGMGRKARFGVKDYVRLVYSSQSLGMVDSNWGTLLPKPARVFAWMDK